MKVNTHTRATPAASASLSLSVRVSSRRFYIVQLFFYGPSLPDMVGPGGRPRRSLQRDGGERSLGLSAAFERAGSGGKGLPGKNGQGKRTEEKGTRGEGVRQKCAKGSAGGNKAFRRGRRGIIFVPSASVFRRNNAPWVPQSRMQPTQKTRLGLL